MEQTNTSSLWDPLAEPPRRPIYWEKSEGCPPTTRTELTSPVWPTLYCEWSHQISSCDKQNFGPLKTEVQTILHAQKSMRSSNCSILNILKQTPAHTFTSPTYLMFLNIFQWKHVFHIKLLDTRPYGNLVKSEEKIIFEDLIDRTPSEDKS